MNTHCYILLFLTAATTSMYLTTWFLMKGDSWRWTKLAAAAISAMAFILMLSGIANNNKAEAYITIAAILIVEEAINSVGQIVRQLYLRRRRQCLLSIFRQEQA